jgi:hypothetical protein
MDKVGEGLFDEAFVTVFGFLRLIVSHTSFTIEDRVVIASDSFQDMIVSGVLSLVVRGVEVEDICLDRFDKFVSIGVEDLVFVVVKDSLGRYHLEGFGSGVLDFF